jgi:hypothetical protein
MTFRLVQELAGGEVLVAVACRVLGISTVPRQRNLDTGLAIPNG